MPNYYDQPIPLDPNTMQPYQASLQQQPNFRWQAKAGAAAKDFLGDRDLALALLANSGWQQGPKRGFGSVLGQSMLQADQAKQGRADDAFKRQYMMAQMQAMGARQGGSVYGAVQPDKFTPESLAKFGETGKYSDLQLRTIGQQFGRYNPGDFTPDSWSEFIKTQDPSNLVRYVAPQNASVEDLNGGKVIVQPDKTGGAPRLTTLTTGDAERAAAGALETSKATGKGIGDATATQAGKAPAKASFDYVVTGFEPLIQKTMQGGLFGVKGKAGQVLDKKDREQFMNQREQLSTELRTIFRIPGEGSLSDQEGAQYGLQLPSPDNEPETNVKILRDLQERVRLRTETAIAAPGAAPSGARKRYNPATGKIENAGS